MNTEIAEYSPTESALTALRDKYAGQVYEVETTKGMQAARDARAELRTLRTTLEKKRVELKAPALERTRLIDAEAKRITAEIAALEDPIDEQIKREEQRKEDEKAERVRAEAARVAGIQKRIDDIRAIPLALALINNDAELLKAYDALAGTAIDDSFAEFAPIAGSVKTETLVKIQQLRDAAVARAAEAKRLADERAELDRLRAAEVERTAAEQARMRAEREAHEAKLAEEREAARAAQAEADRIATEERRKADDAAKAERDRLAAEREEFERAQAEQRRVAEEKARMVRLKALKRDAPSLLVAAIDAHLLLVENGYGDANATLTLGFAIENAKAEGKVAA